MNKKKNNEVFKIWKPHYDDLMYLEGLIQKLNYSLEDKRFWLGYICKPFKEQYPGISIDTYECKINILSEYEFIDEALKETGLKIMFGRKSL
jgi:hypothetical protein